MKIEQFFQAIAFPFRVQTSTPYSLAFESKYFLFDVPKYGYLNENFWEAIDSEGWRTCKAGYAVYARKIPGAEKRFLVLHGLKVKGHWTAKGKSEGLSIVLDATKIEKYINNFLFELNNYIEDNAGQVEAQVRSLVTEHVHEIRSMNTSLYHAGYELQEKLRYDERYKLALAKNVVALSELVSVRIELADLAASNLENPAGEFTAPLSAYKKFDKITKCYIAYAAKREITISLSGDSRGLTKGVENFEMLPLIIIDNAVKYSPDKRGIEVVFSEDDSKIFCRVRSLGPKIELPEYVSIFGKEQRGVHAISSGRTGSGIGLYFAKRLLRTINAEISVVQELEVAVVKARNFFLTTFLLEFVKI